MEDLVKTGNSDHRRKKFLDLAIPMEIDRSLDPGPKFTRALSILIHQIRGVRTGESAATVPRLPLTPGPERANMSGDYGVVRRRVSVGDSLDDEEWSDDLSNQCSRQTTCPDIATM